MAIRRQVDNPLKPSARSSGPFVGALKTLPAQTLRTAFRWVDSAYFLTQAALKGIGFQTLTREVPPEKMTPEGLVALLPNAPGRWPALEIPLPFGALFQLSVESMLQRSALWVAPCSLTEAEESLRAQLGRYAASARDTWRGTTHVFFIDPLHPSSEWPDVVGSVTLLLSDNGLAMMGVRQERGPSRRTRRLIRAATDWPLLNASGL